MPRTKNFNISKDQVTYLKVKGNDITITFSDGGNAPYTNFKKFNGNYMSFDSKGIYIENENFVIPSHGRVSTLKSFNKNPDGQAIYSENNAGDMKIFFATELDFYGTVTGNCNFTSDKFFEVELI